MKISGFLAPGRVVVDLRVPDKRRLLEELARRSAAATRLDAGEVLEALATREQLGSTGMGAGVAIPHSRLTTVAEPVGFFARLRTPVDFEAVDGQRVDLVFLLLLPAKAAGDQLSVLACVARRLRDERTAFALRGARDAASAYAVLTGADPQAPAFSAS